MDTEKGEDETASETLRERSPSGWVSVRPISKKGGPLIWVFFFFLI